MFGRATPGATTATSCGRCSTRASFPSTTDLGRERIMVNDLSRRTLLKSAAATSLSGWLHVLAAHAAPARGKHKSCIVLWMDGGPSHKDTFDLKPGTKDAGEFAPIQTSVRSEEHTSELQSLTNLVCR